jgi:hypothetical protein
MFGVTDCKAALPVTLHEAVREFRVLLIRTDSRVNWMGSISRKSRHFGRLRHYVNINVNESHRYRVLFWLFYIQIWLMRY